MEYVAAGEAYIVLILVLVEHTLGDCNVSLNAKQKYVLILVLVEHTLGGSFYQLLRPVYVRLNPCFSGTYSRRMEKFIVINRERESLNPCFSGTYSRRPSRHK